MKKFLAIAVIAATLTSCGGGKTDDAAAADTAGCTVRLLRRRDRHDRLDGPRVPALVPADPGRMGARARPVHRSGDGAARQPELPQHLRKLSQRLKRGIHHDRSS